MKKPISKLYEYLKNEFLFLKRFFYVLFTIQLQIQVFFVFFFFFFLIEYVGKQTKKN